MSDIRGTVAISGASGYIGRHLVELALAEGRRVVAMSRTPLGRVDPTLSEASYDLTEPGVLAIPDSVDLIVHLAARTDTDDIDDGIEERAAEHLLSAAVERNARFVLASTLSSRGDAPSSYGRVKHALERLVLDRGGTVVRLGLVCGGERPAGLFAKLAGLVERVPVVPRLVPAPRVQPIFVGDACRALLTAGRPEHTGASFDVAHDESLPFDQLLVAVARHRFARRIRTIPIPVALLRLGLSAVGRLGWFEGLSTARLDSLTDLPLADTAVSLRRLEIIPAPLAVAVARPAERRRRLLTEGAAMLRYVGLSRRTRWAARHYARAVETHQDGHAFDPARLGIRRPALLAASERGARRRGEDQLTWRFDAALAVAEATDGGEAANGLRGLAGLARAGAAEALWRVVSPGGGRRPRAPQ